MKNISKKLNVVVLLAIACLLLFFTVKQFSGANESSTNNNSTLQYSGILTASLLDESLAAGTAFLLKNQEEEGNFVYEYNFLTDTFSNQDNQVRQAGALWGIALIHKEHPSDATKAALKKGLAYFSSRSHMTEEGGRYVLYPSDWSGSTGTIALMCLSLTEFLQTDLTEEEREEYKTMLDEYLTFLLSLRMENGQFYSSYSHEDGTGSGSPSPYFDGESLLALTKAAKYAGYTELSDRILESAEHMYTLNVLDALEMDPDSATTKGFYQWSSMSFYEIYTSGWEGVEPYAERTIDLAYWMIDTHKTLERTKNTGYAYEGIAVAWELARLTMNNAAQEKLGAVINEGMMKLISWQVGGPNPNSYLLQNTDMKSLLDSNGYGGVMNRKDEPELRIDVTQHQMHATILVRRFLFPV